MRCHLISPAPRHAVACHRGPGHHLLARHARPRARTETPSLSRPVHQLTDFASPDKQADAHGDRAGGCTASCRVLPAAHRRGVPAGRVPGGGSSPSKERRDHSAGQSPAAPQLRARHHDHGLEIGDVSLGSVNGGAGAGAARPHAHASQRKRGATSVEDEAWELLRESVVRYCGSPVGTIAACDPDDPTPLNYDQVFIRDFVLSGVAFLLKGEHDIDRNFILHTLQLQIRAGKKQWTAIVQVKD